MDIIVIDIYIIYMIRFEFCYFMIGRINFGKGLIRMSCCLDWNLLIVLCLESIYYKCLMVILLVVIECLV